MYLRTGGALLSLAHLASVARASTCQAGQPCKVSTADWQAFNQTISGRLRATTMLSSPCFPNQPDYNKDECGIIEQNWTNGSFREQYYGALEYTTWEGCGTENCFPGIFGPQGTNCSLGRMSPLYVAAETVEDISATFNFIEKTGVELVVKNTGHDLLGRSAAANTLALWTHNLQNKTFEPSFTAYNCPAANKQNVGIIGAGVVAEDAITFFANYGMMVTAGGCLSVGLAGGFGQGGGHSPLSPTYGLMVDQAIEFDVVTPDGTYRTINECNDADLFWAMRGGGGQLGAVLVNYKFQLHPQTQWTTWRVEATIAASNSVTNNTALRDVLTALANNQTTWTKNRVSGWDAIAPTQVSMLEVLPALPGQNSTDQLKNLTAAFNTFISNHPGVNVTMNAYETWDDEYSFYASQEGFLNSHSILGIGTVTPSRLITADNFASEEKVDALVSAVLQALQVVQDKLGSLASSVSFAVIKNTPFNTPDTGATSANPAWRNTLWHFITGGGWVPGTPTATSEQIAGAAMAAVDTLKKPLATQASYLNEASGDECDWEWLFWGENYEKLLQVKKKYDPKTLLNCKKCIGYQPHQQRYSCYSKNPVPSVPYPFN